MAATVVIRPGLIDRLKTNSGIADDEAFARLIGTSRSTLARLKTGGPASLAVIAGIAQAFNLGLGEVAMLAPASSDEDRRKDVA